MQAIIRPMREQDRAEILSMMRVFYASPAVSTNGSEEIFQSDIDHCLSDCPYLEGYVFEAESKILGYAMTAKSFSTEFGKPCIWLEDLYLKEDARGLGIGGRFLEYVAEKHPDAICRLEVEEENERAVAVYRKHGYQTLPYMEMKR